MSPRYSRSIYWSEQDQLYVAFVRELPGCLADGMTPHEAVDNLEVIIAEWLEVAQEDGREIPKPITQERLEKAGAEAVAELAKKISQVIESSKISQWPERTDAWAREAVQREASLSEKK